MYMLRRVIAAVFLVALVVVVRLFPDHNRAPIDVDLLVGAVSGVELWLLLLGTFAAGIGSALLVSGFFWLRSSFLGRRDRKVISELEAEVHHLRNLPLAGSDLP